MKTPKRYSIMEDYMDASGLYDYYENVIEGYLSKDEDEETWKEEEPNDYHEEELDDYSEYICTDTIGELSIALDIKPKHLGWLYSTWNTWNRWYKVYVIPKRREGFRVISAPQGLLRSVQRAINAKILSKFPCSDYCHGFRKGHSIVDNAAPHIRQPMIIKVDIKDFFPSVSAARIFGLFRFSGYSITTARFLTRLCTYNGTLPQGAPTSPMLANRICYKLDKRISGLASKHSAQYTRYADDITISGSTDIVLLLPLIKEIIYQEGFVVAENKVRVCRRNMRQQVTGLTVNEGVKIPRKLKKTIRAMIHYAGTGRTPHIGQERLSEKALQGYKSYLRFIDPEYGDKLHRVSGRETEFLNP